jgi:hypothetical protein
MRIIWRDGRPNYTKIDAQFDELSVDLIGNAPVSTAIQNSNCTDHKRQVS